MEENQLNEHISKIIEPATNTDNSYDLQTQATEVQQAGKGKSQDPSGLLLGKFKNVEDLSKAYQQLEKLQGVQSAELGSLRENANIFRFINARNDDIKRLNDSAKDLHETAKKYSSYFADPTFRQIYGNAFLALGDNLDTDRLVNLLEGYVSSRIFAHEKQKAETAETQNAIGGLQFEKNENQKSKKSFEGKRINDMSPKEIDELLEQFI